MKTIGYLRVSTQEQDTQKNKFEILEFANSRKFGNVDFVEEKVSGKVDWRKRILGKVVEDLGKGDVLLLPEISRLGRSTLDCLEILKILSSKGVRVYAIKGNFALDDSIQSKIFATVFSLMAEIEREFISIRTKESLAARKRKGLPLGRPRGSIGKSRLDDYREEILAFIAQGSTKTWIAKRYGVARNTLNNFLKRGNNGT